MAGPVEPLSFPQQNHWSVVCSCVNVWQSMPWRWTSCPFSVCLHTHTHTRVRPLFWKMSLKCSFVFWCILTWPESFPSRWGNSHVSRACKNIFINACWIKKRMLDDLKTRQLFKIPEKLTFWKFMFFISQQHYVPRPRSCIKRWNEAILLNNIPKSTRVGKYSHVFPWSSEKKNLNAV